MKNKILSAVLAVGCFAMACLDVSAKTATHVSQVYSSTAAANTTNNAIGQASEVITFNIGSNVISGESITIGFGKAGRATYTFTNATGTNIPLYGVLVGNNAAQSATNLLQAINGANTGNGTNYGTNTPANTLVTVAQTSSNTLTITATTTSLMYLGSAGNYTSGGAGISVSAISSDIQFPFANPGGLFGGYDNVVTYIPWGPSLAAVGVNIELLPTNTVSTNNLTFNFGFGAGEQGARSLKSAGYLGTPQNSTVTISPTNGVQFLHYTTNWSIGTAGLNDRVALIGLANPNSTNNVPYNMWFSWVEDDGK